MFLSSGRRRWIASRRTGNPGRPRRFLRLWLRRGTLEPILLRELGSELSRVRVARTDGRVRLRAFPLGSGWGTGRQGTSRSSPSCR